MEVHFTPEQEAPLAKAATIEDVPNWLGLALAIRNHSLSGGTAAAAT
jgi:hypothetical protein